VNSRTITTLMPQYNAAMVKPDELESERGQLIWSAMVVAANGDVIVLRQLPALDPGLGRAEYW